ncbi:glycoside hydrolase family 32 protein [Spirosoma oryzicola]|uniref:glycoside hydrolase family 32 protein n=1 Tax=Spirosoma oryzicola TaxID=2898794 RepID=UPI001E59F2A8|nr:glycoside hydrolase family 32 protein [Spirosoma oryzicola]UHG92783.1 glycoside hydrolase family 32 protein [Spirosoma oryzicola]
MTRTLVVLLAFGLMTSTLLAQRITVDTTYKQPYRPQYHFSSRTNWINDPNGLVYYDGEYHLFYQHNPFGNQWGHMTWGHAISRDLVHWQELPPAIPEEGATMIYSGSCVIDKTNTSGFGQDGRVPMVAIYTGARQDNQSQHIAYSLDKGRTWIKYTRNPIIDLKRKDFRDPKVFWHEPSQHWVMIVLLPTDKKALFYKSSNLKEWTKAGEFTANDSPASIWECPDLVEVPVDGTMERKWVLMLSMGNNGPAGGSGMQYYVGQFNGSTFINESKPGELRYVDWGKDYYAAITFNNLPRRGNRGAISIGWMNNLQYANDVPTTPFRGAMTLPRELRLVKVPAPVNRYELRQQPIQELKPLLGPTFQWTGTDVAQLNQSLASNSLSSDTYWLQLELEAAKTGVGVRVKKEEAAQGKGEETVIGYDPASQQLYVDRSRSGHVGFKKEFPGRFTAPLKPQNGRISLQIWVDRSSIEVFGNNGEVTLTNQIFPKSDSRGIEFFGEGLRSVLIRSVEPIWK